MGKVPKRVVAKALEKMLARLQADRLLLAEAIDRAKRVHAVKSEGTPPFF
jgi:hypothetical protein